MCFTFYFVKKYIKYLLLSFTYALTSNFVDAACFLSDYKNIYQDRAFSGLYTRCNLALKNPIQ